MTPIGLFIVKVVAFVRQRPWLDGNDPELHPERGATTMEWAALGAASVAVILVLTAALEVAGVEIIGWIKDQLIGGGTA